jgi:hypothetical protein
MTPYPSCRFTHHCRLSAVILAEVGMPFMSSVSTRPVPSDCEIPGISVSH